MSDLDTHIVAVVRTDDQVDSLPIGSVLFDVDRDVIIRDDQGWRFWGDDSVFTEDAVICLPALVIHVGGAACDLDAFIEELVNARDQLRAAGIDTSWSET